MKSLTIGFDWYYIYCCIDIGAYETKTIYATTNSEEIITNYIEYWEIATKLSNTDYQDIEVINREQISDTVLKYTVYNPNSVSFSNVNVFLPFPEDMLSSISFDENWIPYMYCSYLPPDIAKKIDGIITYDKSMSMDISYSINSIDQCNTNSLKDLGLKPFDIVAVLWESNVLFLGYIIDNRLDTSFGNQNYEYTINSPLWILGQKQTEAKTSFLQLYAKECADLCNLELDYKLNVNPLINIGNGTYFNELKKVLVYTKNYNVRFYVDYENGKLVFTDDTEFINTKGSEIKPINYSYEWDTDITNTVQW
jgi:hypothetical protein